MGVTTIETEEAVASLALDLMKGLLGFAASKCKWQPTTSETPSNKSYIYFRGITSIEVEEAACHFLE